MMECTDSLDEFSKLHTVLCYNLQWFAQDGEGGEKTEPATEKKLKDAREEGKVAKSKELTAAFDLIVLFLVLKIFISFVGGNLIGTKQSRRHIMRCGRDYWRWRMPF